MQTEKLSEWNHPIKMFSYQDFLRLFSKFLTSRAHPRITVQIQLLSTLMGESDVCAI